MKKLYVFFVGLLLSLGASATSVLDAAQKTAIEGGFTDVKDTFSDILSTAWPILLAIVALMLAPRIVKKLMKMVGSA